MKLAYLFSLSLCLSLFACADADVDERDPAQQEDTDDRQDEFKVVLGKTSICIYRAPNNSTSDNNTCRAACSGVPGSCRVLDTGASSGDCAAATCGNPMPAR